MASCLIPASALLVLSALVCAYSTSIPTVQPITDDVKTLSKAEFHAIALCMAEAHANNDPHFDLAMFMQKNHFDTLDRNGDGVISEDEAHADDEDEHPFHRTEEGLTKEVFNAAVLSMAEAHTRDDETFDLPVFLAKNRFEMFDTDGDRVILEHEMHAVADKVSSPLLQSAKSLNRQAFNTAVLSMASAQIADDPDFNVSEFMAKNRFEDLDFDGDGEITEDDLNTHVVGDDGNERNTAKIRLLKKVRGLSKADPNFDMHDYIERRRTDREHACVRCQVQ